MSRPRENDVRSSSQKFDFDVQMNECLSLSVYRGCVMIENDYTMMRRSMKRMEVKMEWVSLCMNLWPHLRIPSASNAQTYYMLHTVWGAEVQKRLGACDPGAPRWVSGDCNGIVNRALMEGRGRAFFLWGVLDICLKDAEEFADDGTWRVKRVQV